MQKEGLAIQLGELNYDKGDNGSISDIGVEKMNTGENSEDQSGSMNGQQTKKKKFSTPKEASINLFKGYIGSGILALPYAFDEVGYLLSTFIFITVAIAIYYTMGLLFQIADKNAKPGMGYPQLAEQLLGAKGVLCVKSMLVLFQVGCCVSYVIFFIKFFEHAFNTVGNMEDDILYIIAALCIIAPMQLVNDVAFFSKASIVGNSFVISTLILIYIHNFHAMATSPNISENLKDLADFSRIPMMIGISIYAFEAIGLVFSIRNSLEDVKEFPRIFRNVNILICTLYISFAVCGVIALGHAMDEIILFQLPKAAYVHMFQIAYAIALILSYPLQLLPSLQIIESGRKLKNFIRKDESGWRLRQFGVRIIITLIICTSALSVPHFAVFLNMVGSIAGTALQFFFPIMMYQKLFGDEVPKKQQWLNKGVLIFGGIGGLCGFIFSVIELTKDEEERQTD